MQPHETIENFEARSAKAKISDDVAVLTFLTAIPSRPNVAVYMTVEVLERLHFQITRELDARKSAAQQQ